MDGFDLSEFPKLSHRQIEILDGGLAKDIPKLVQTLQQAFGPQSGSTAQTAPDGANPFDGTADHSSGEPWVVDATAKAKWDNLFFRLGASGTPPRLDGMSARPMMMESGLPQTALRQIWDLADCDNDGFLDGEEFALAMHLTTSARISGASSIPETLPASFIPPTKR
eukprot:Plantae.Rhodophyta-Rhodochaete_pulchella.ctg31588.p3 GENE.Plantae.Rhodophyta-Rhodochaete_pulchella.ctg31588~~Plantae.Rhodophyta-Rhodochaete_pulchella.ctg31588.p3  ORF type:complete len:167 (-),score=25.45 Plantae.Rhodophyta-Rhodochaete_pulchella.ctg31588:650-1150(-)